MIARRAAEQTKAQMVAASYTAWQMGAGKDKPFRQYLDSLGLGEKKRKMTKNQKKAMSEKAQRIFERIAAMDKPRLKRKK